MQQIQRVVRPKTIDLQRILQEYEKE